MAPCLVMILAALENHLLYRREPKALGDTSTSQTNLPPQTCHSDIHSCPRHLLLISNSSHSQVFRKVVLHFTFTFCCCFAFVRERICSRKGSCTHTRHLVNLIPRKLSAVNHMCSAHPPCFAMVMGDHGGVLGGTFPGIASWMYAICVPRCVISTSFCPDKSKVPALFFGRRHCPSCHHLCRRTTAGG